MTRRDAWLKLNQQAETCGSNGHFAGASHNIEYTIVGISNWQATALAFGNILSGPSQ